MYGLEYSSLHFAIQALNNAIQHAVAAFVRICTTYTFIGTTQRKVNGVYLVLSTYSFTPVLLDMASLTICVTSVIHTSTQHVIYYFF